MQALAKKSRVYVDLETTGLDPAIHEIIEVAIIRQDGKMFTSRVKPRHIEKALPKALEVNGYSPEEWAKAPYLETILPWVYDLLKDAIIVGHNVRFDMAFIDMALKRNGYKPVDYHLADTVTLAYEHLVPCGLESLSLKNVCKFLGIPPEPDLHRALGGALRCKKVYEMLIRAGCIKRIGWRLEQFLHPILPPKKNP